jgi:hypothetical protein
VECVVEIAVVWFTHCSRKGGRGGGSVKDIAFKAVQGLDGQGDVRGCRVLGSGLVDPGQAGQFFGLGWVPRCRVALKSALPHFVWRNYPETGKFRRDSREFEEALVARERCCRSKR